MSKNRPKPAAALYFSGALSATPVGVHQKMLVCEHESGLLSATFQS